jgi:hypothetical protein
VQSQIVWRNMDEEALTKDFTRLNSSCSPNELSPGMLALMQHAQERRLSSEGTSSPPRPAAQRVQEEPHAQRAQAPAAAPPQSRGAAPCGEKTGSVYVALLAPAPAVRACGATRSATRSDATGPAAGREMWLEEEERLRELEGNRAPVLVMGTEPMCTRGGCGYFSDDGK